MSRDHRKLRAFHLADELVLQTYRATKAFPREELFGLTSQMRRAAVSIAANIVEGCARNGQREFLNHLNIAFGSARELGYFIDLAERLSYVTPTVAESWKQQQDETTRVIAALMKAFDRDLPKTSRPKTQDSTHV